MPLSTLDRKTRFAALAAVAALGLAACGDASDTTGASGTSTPGVTATGTPVLVGFINDDQGAAAIPEGTTAAKAAATYVNEHGGINGHPIELVTCSTAATPESTVSCANEMIAKKVSVVSLGTVVAADALLAPLKEAKVGIFSVTGGGQTNLADPFVTYLSTSQALTFAGVWKFFKEVKTLKPILIAPDFGPATKQLAEQAIIPSAKASGLDLGYLLYNPASPDWAAAITAAKSKGSDGLYILGTEGDCANGIKTAKQLGWDGVLFGGTCTQYAETLGKAAEGVYSLSYLVPAGSKDSAPAGKAEQIQQYVAAMEAAGAEAKVGSSYALAGFSGVMTVVSALKTVTGEIDATTAQAAVQVYKGDVFLGGTVDCGNRPAPGGTCGTQFAALKTGVDGTQEVLGKVFLDTTGA